MQKVLALAAAETKLLLRNKTVAITALGIPIVLGLVWAWSFGRAGGAIATVGVVGLQIGVVLGMAVYVTATQTVVARRARLVLKRMRTSGLSDAGLLTATIAPAVVIGFIQLVIFAVLDATVLGVQVPTDPLALVAAVLGGMVFVVAAALATTVVTGTAERAQYTTLPLVFLLIGGPIAASIVPEGPWNYAVSVVPGAGIGQLTGLAFRDGPLFGGLYGVAAFAALLAWAALFAFVTARSFRWDQRYVV